MKKNINSKILKKFSFCIIVIAVIISIAAAVVIITSSQKKTTGTNQGTENKTTRLENDYNWDGVVDRGELVDFQETLPESVLKFGPPEYRLSCDDVVSAKIVTNYLYDELEGERREYTEIVTDKSKIQAFTDKFNSLLQTSAPDEFDTWWCDDDSGDEYIIIYLYKADGSYTKVSSQSPIRIRYEDEDRRTVSPHDRKALLESLYDIDANHLRWIAQGIHTVDMSDDEFIKKAQTITKDYDWLSIEEVFGEAGGWTCSQGYDESHISNGEYVLIIDEGYQVYLRKISDPDYRLQID